MTILDTTHKLARPVEEIANALRAGGNYEDMARAALRVLRSRGFITLDGLQAIKAEQGKGK